MRPSSEVQIPSQARPASQEKNLMNKPPLLTQEAASTAQEAHLGPMEMSCFVIY